MAMNAWKEEMPPPVRDRSAVLEKTRHFQDDWRASLSRLVETTFPDLRAALTDEGWSDLLDELAQAATAEARECVLQSWYVTMLLRSDPTYWEHIAQAGTGRVYTSEELKKALGL